MIGRCSPKLIRQPQERTSRVRKDLSQTSPNFSTAPYLPSFYPHLAVDRRVSASDYHSHAGKSQTNAIANESLVLLAAKQFKSGDIRGEIPIMQCAKTPVNLTRKCAWVHSAEITVALSRERKYPTGVRSDMRPEIQ